MTEVAQTFGRTASAAASPPELLELERGAGQSHRFRELDAFVTDLILSGVRGERLAVFKRDRSRSTVSVPALNAAENALIAEHFALERQQARGAWFIPEEASLKIGRVNFFHYMKRYPQGATDLSQGEGGKVALSGCPGAVLIWSILEPFFDPLLVPFDLRGRWAGEKSKEDQQKLWAEYDALIAVLGFDLEEVLAVMRYGGGWSRLRAAEQVEAKRRLLRALAEQTSEETIARYRAYRLQSLLSHYYRKAKADGRATMRQVLTRSEERTLSGFFGGDWLAFLEYLSEEPHPDEQIATALPETRIYGAASTRVTEVAKAAHLPVAEIERMLAAYWNQGAGKSPIDERIEVLRRFWERFDELHARQRRGLHSLWGLIEEEGVPRNAETGSPFQSGSHKRLLKAELNRAIEELWGTIVLPRWPDRIVSSRDPHSLMVETFGPALSFWQGCALTAWFVCEGTYSRTDVRGLAENHRRELGAMAELGCPVDQSVFDQLAATEDKLPPSEPMWDEDDELEAGEGFVHISTSSGSRREGFEILRDIITRHRRQWAERHLDKYLRARWQSEVRETGRDYNRLIAERGKPPTAKQFAKAASNPVNHWFGGDFAALFASLGEKSPVRSERSLVIPTDRAAFVQAVYAALGGEPLRRRDEMTHDPEAMRAETEAEQRKWRLMGLAEESLRFLQLQEALGRPPELGEFGLSKFEWVANELWGKVDRGWVIYTDAIRRAWLQPPEPAAAARTEDDGLRRASTSREVDDLPDDFPSVGLEPKPTENRKRSWLSRLLDS